MNNFNFGFEDVKANASARMFLPWNIYDVKFAGCSVVEYPSKADPNVVYKILKTRFENDEGYYEESIFFPKEGDDKRPTYQNKDGHDYQAPSNWERTKTFIAQLGTTLNPEGFAKLQAASSKFKSFDDMCKALITITDPKKGTQTKLKLVGKVDKNGNVNAALPKFVAVTKEGKLFTSDNFIGNNLYFKPYEESQRAKYLNAKPTNMANDPIDTPKEEEEVGLDLNDLL